MVLFRTHWAFKVPQHSSENCCRLLLAFCACESAALRSLTLSGFPATLSWCSPSTRRPLVLRTSKQLAGRRPGRHTRRWVNTERSGMCAGSGFGSCSFTRMPRTVWIFITRWLCVWWHSQFGFLQTFLASGLLSGEQP